MELKTILDEDADDIKSLREAVDVLLKENVELRREISILRTPSESYFGAFVACSPTSGGRDAATDSVLHHLSVLRCGAKIRATEDAIIQAGADAALFRHRCAALENEKEDRDIREEALQLKIRELQQLVEDKHVSVEEWKARSAANEALLVNARESTAAARAVASELECIVHELRDQLATEKERSSILAMDNGMLSGALSEVRTGNDQTVAQLLTIQSLEQEVRDTRVKLDKARVRCVELEMRLERTEKVA